MSSIVTFYSYKGGVGRSMALANIAYVLAQGGKRVLMVDWDLEAPGLERYFNAFSIDKRSDGLLSLLMEYQKDASPDYKKFLWTITTQNQQPLYLINSGREKDPIAYSKALENFDWEKFFSEGKGGLHLEQLRKQWLEDFDIVLIDSRTGLSDASGICTILLPDTLVPMFTANYQSLFGIRDIVNYIHSARQKLAVDRMALSILPVPSRFGTRVEFKESQEWLDRIADILKDCFDDWLPKWITPRYVLEQIKIPQVDYFSFGEKLSVVEHGVSDPEGMGYIYSRLAALLVSDFSDIETFIGASYFKQKKQEYLSARNESAAPVETGRRLYEIYISGPRAAYQWTRELLLPALTEYLSEQLGHEPAIFYEATESSSVESWPVAIKNALESSKVLVYLLPQSEGSSGIASQELLLFQSRQRLTDTKLIFPVLYYTGNKDISKVPFDLAGLQWTDLSTYNLDHINRSTKINAEFAKKIEALAREISDSLAASSFGKSTKRTDKTDDNFQARFKEMEVLAAEYEALRERMPAGTSRTMLMEDIVKKMKKIADDVQPGLKDLMLSSSPGKRLAAIVALQSMPNIEHVIWLAEHVGDSEKPFIGYQASVALFIASRAFREKFNTEMRHAVTSAINNLNSYTFKDPNQTRTLLAAMAELTPKS